jgi:hypothetical protein
VCPTGRDSRLQSVSSPIPIAKPVYARYRELLEERYPHRVV